MMVLLASPIIFGRTILNGVLRKDKQQYFYFYSIFNNSGLLLQNVKYQYFHSDNDGNVLFNVLRPNFLFLKDVKPCPSLKIQHYLHYIT